jgi:hypothetical protein
MTTPPEVLADALQDRVHPASGKLIHSAPVLRTSNIPDDWPRIELRAPDYAWARLDAVTG